MSWQAKDWVLNESDVDNYVDFRVLMLIADRADEEGAASWPSVASMAEKIRRSPRTVQRSLERMEKAGRIRPGDQSLLPSKLATNRRPRVWDVVLTNPEPAASSLKSRATPHVARKPSGVTPDVASGVTPDVASGVTPDVASGVTPDVDITVLHPLRDETTHPSETAPRARGPEAAQPRQGATRITELRTRYARGWELVQQAVPGTFADDDRSELANLSGQALEEGKDPAAVLGALHLWVNKPGAGPRLFPYLIKDAARDAARAGLLDDGTAPLLGNDREVREHLLTGARLARQAREDEAARQQALEAAPAHGDLFAEILALPTHQEHAA